MTPGKTSFSDTSVEASAGDILIFPHEYNHSSPSGQEKTVIRSDIVYEELIR